MIKILFGSINENKTNLISYLFARITDYNLRGFV